MLPNIPGLTPGLHTDTQLPLSSVSLLGKKCFPKKLNMLSIQWKT